MRRVQLVARSHPVRHQVGVAEGRPRWRVALSLALLAGGFLWWAS